MYRIIAYFDYQDVNQEPLAPLHQLIEQWRYNGQIIGREFAITYQAEKRLFCLHLATPEENSLQQQWNNAWVNEALKVAQYAGIPFVGYEVIGLDYYASPTHTGEAENFYILYTTYLETASPLYGGGQFSPIPLYKIAQTDPTLSHALIKWQEDWQACDQLQMNGLTLESASLAQIADLDSELTQRGRALSNQITQLTNVPTYYYLYRLGHSPQREYARRCPNCGQHWRLPQSLHQIFDFQCADCRLISNLSWEIKT